MNTKTIDLLVLNQDQESRIPLATFSLEELPKKASFKSPMEASLLSNMGEQFTVRALVEAYLNSSLKIYNLFRKAVNTIDLYEKVTFENIMARPFAYAQLEAYEKMRPIIPKEKESDADVFPIAHLCWKEGIFVALFQQQSMEHLLGSNLHEQSHHMHYLLYPEHYNHSDVTIIETMAIFAEMKCKMPVNYLPQDYNPETKVKETPHYRAQELLQRLESKPSYAAASLQSQWNFLLQYNRHEALSERIEKLP